MSAKRDNRPIKSMQGARQDFKAMAKIESSKATTTLTEQIQYLKKSINVLNPNTAGVQNPFVSNNKPSQASTTPTNEPKPKK